MNAGYYTLSEHVHACETSGVLIFLDLRRDQYFSLDRAASGLLAPLLSGRAQGVVVDSAQRKALCATIDMLIAQKLLTANGVSLDKPFPVQLARATRSLISARYRTLSGIPAAWCIDFLNAAVTAACKLKWWSITRVVKSVRARRSRNGGLRFDPQATAELMAVYGALRPLFPKPYICLFDSLAALEFLARQGCWPKWVFGVKASPFGAHCWLQEEELVLNDSVEHVSAFTPIMVV
jgi:hypothetical protein